MPTLLTAVVIFISDITNLIRSFPFFTCITEPVLVLNVPSKFPSMILSGVKLVNVRLMPEPV